MATIARSVTPVSAPATTFPGRPPTPLTAFVGRAPELAEIRDLLQAGRLVTLTGGGGSGKTRIAAEIAARDADAYPGGVAWVDLASLTDPTALARHVSSELGLVDEAGRAPLDGLTRRLAGARTLVILDNCEHLVGACAELGHALLAACPELTILATSREALGVDGETAWLVPPLSLPPPAPHPTADDVSASEAGQLFAARARAATPGFVLDDRTAPFIDHICRRLDGLPLALELAAARVKVLTPKQIAIRLDDVFSLLTTSSRTAIPRHRTLREAIDWSHALLTSCEQVLFRRLGVFRGGWTLEAAEAVCSDDTVRADAVLDLLAALVDKSLVRADTVAHEARYSFLEPVRHFAHESLARSGELDVTRARQAAFFLALAEASEPFIRGGSRRTEPMARLEAEHGNLRAALDFFGESDDRLPDRLRLDVALLWLHFGLGLFEEPRRRISEGLGRAPDLPAALRGAALTALGHQAIWLGDYGAVFEPMSSGVALLREAGDAEPLSFALSGLGAAVGLGGDPETADALFDEAEAVLGGREGAEAGGFPKTLLFAFASYWRGVVARVHGDVGAARASFELSAGVARAFDRHPTIAHPLAELGLLLARGGELDTARTCLGESLAIHLANDDRWGLARVMEGAAQLAAARGEQERAARILAASDQVRESIGAGLPPHAATEREGLVDSIRSALGEAAFAMAWAAGRATPLRRIAPELLAPLVGDLEGGTPQATPREAPAPSLPADPPQALTHGAATRAPATAPAAAPAHVTGTGSGAQTTDTDVRVDALGPLRIWCAGEMVDGGRWGSAKPRELLLFLLTRPDGATREQVGLALWPDASGDRMSNSFHVTLHRLRKALGHPEWIVSSADRYRVSPELRCDFDVVTFEREASALLRGRTAPDIDRLRAALGRYRGPFLDGEIVGDWHLDIRGRLARMHLDALLTLGGWLVAEQRYAEAADAYRDAVVADDLHEPAYRELMTCLARTGDRAQALRLYQRLVHLLRDELDAEPEPETVQLHARLQEGDPIGPPPANASAPHLPPRL